jgi:hypothetical protein
LEEILLIGKVLINQHIAHECLHILLMGEITPEKQVELLLFFGHFELDILFLLHLNLLLYFGDYY